MRILLIHNYTEGFAIGGEGKVFEDERKILEEHGHVVHPLICSNSEATEANLIGKAKAFWHAPWSPVGYARVAVAIKEFQPDIIHSHNYFLMLSPSIFRAAKDYYIPVVVTLHNYRLISPCSQLVRNGRICELCVGRNPWRILLYRCYRDNFLYSLLRYRFYYLSQKIHDWHSDIDKFITLTEFGKQMHIRGGIPSHKIIVKPNSCLDPLAGADQTEPGYGALFLGMITPEKGVENLVKAWEDIDYPLDLLGEGSMRKSLEAEAPAPVKFHGVLSYNEVFNKLRQCAFLVMPSIWYEGLPLVLIEAMASGRPVIASRLGAMAKVVEDGVTGLLFEHDNLEDMREKIMNMINSKELRVRLGRAARQRYLESYTPERTYEKLIQIYEETLTSWNNKQ